MGTDNKDSIKKTLDNLDTFEKYVNEWLKYKDLFKGITLGDFEHNKDAQKNDYLIQIEVLFNKAILEIENDPKNKLIDPNKLEKLINLFIRKNVVFPLDKDKEVKEYINKKIIEYLLKVKTSIEIERETNQNYKTLNYREFVYLCFELKLLHESYNPELAKEIRQIYEKYEHSIFNKIKLRLPITEKTDIYSIVKQYNSDSKIDEIVKKVNDYIKTLKLKP